MVDLFFSTYDGRKRSYCEK